VAFYIHVEGMNVTIKCIVIDECAYAYVVSLSCWKSIGSRSLSHSMTMLTAFDGRSFRPHVIISAFPVQLGGNTVEDTV
jgi:hypothetical protein